MCELLALNFNKHVRPSFSFTGFQHRAKGNPHGWGIARFEGRACQIFKEAKPADQSPLANFVRDYPAFQSHLFIGHVRLRSRGSYGLAETHPFSRPFRKRDFVFAHNGTVTIPEQHRPKKFRPVGTTDSELLMCRLLTDLSEKGIRFEDFDKIEKLLQGYNSWGIMNLLFSDGRRLYCYRDQSGYKGLHFTTRKAPFSTARLVDEDWTVDLSHEKDPDLEGVVIASQPLTDEKWVGMEEGRLGVVEGGEMVDG